MDAEELVKIIDGSTLVSSCVFDGTYYQWIDEDKNPIAEFIIFYSFLGGGIGITNLKVHKEYRGKGLSYKIIDCAVKKFGARYLAVEKNNHIAKHVYDKYGFKVIDEDDDLYYMSYTEH